MRDIKSKFEVSTLKAKIEGTQEVLEILVTHIARLEKQIEIYREKIKSLQSEGDNGCMTISA